MAAVPIKPEYGPTLGRLLAPRWRAASRRAARAVIAARASASLALLVGVVLTLLNATYSHGGAVPFSFSYRSLYRVDARTRRLREGSGARRATGALEYSFAVDPLALPPYTGASRASCRSTPAATSARCARRYPDFVLRGEGKTRVNTRAGYQVLYTRPSTAARCTGATCCCCPNARRARAAWRS